MKGTLPTRPMEKLGDDEQGNSMWQLLLQCWTRESGDRPSSGQVVGTVSGAVSVRLFTYELNPDSWFLL